MPTLEIFHLFSSFFFFCLLLTRKSIGNISFVYEKIFSKNFFLPSPALFVKFRTRFMCCIFASNRRFCCCKFKTNHCHVLILARYWFSKRYFYVFQDVYFALQIFSYLLSFPIYQVLKAILRVFFFHLLHFFTYFLWL